MLTKEQVTALREGAQKVLDVDRKEHPRFDNLSDCPICRAWSDFEQLDLSPRVVLELVSRYERQETK